MSVKRGNLKADTVVKNYWRNNEQFADTEESSVLEHREYAESIGV